VAKDKHLAAKAKDYPPTVIRELEQIEADLGGRQALVGLLTLAPLTPDLRYVLGLLGDPLHADRTLAAICARGNILPGDLLKHLGAAALMRGQTLAKQAIGNGIPAVVGDVMRKAAPYTLPCGRCVGTGSITPDPTPDEPNPTHGPCPHCLGGGSLLYQPELETQKLAIEMAALIQKGGGLNIALQQNQITQGGGAGGGALEKLQALTDKILYGEVAAVDGEIVDPSAEPLP
jgi:hypothetical protein